VFGSFEHGSSPALIQSKEPKDPSDRPLTLGSPGGSANLPTDSNRELHSRILPSEPLREEIRALWEAVIEAGEAQPADFFKIS
jgi:hypothetical protein